MYRFVFILLIALACQDAEAKINWGRILKGAVIGAIENVNLNESSNFKLCTFDELDYKKCLYTLQMAENSSISLPMECVLENSRESCLTSVKDYKTDMVVLTGHGYKAARKAGLEPVIFERDSTESLYIAVAPRGISLVDIAEAPLVVDVDNHRAFHAAAFFNHQRGHNICPMIYPAKNGISIKIVDSADYIPTADEILICADRSFAEAKDYLKCNVEAQLQRAVFTSAQNVDPLVISDMKDLFDIILKHFNADNDFNFFSSFEGTDNLIFKNNAVAFDLEPTFINGLTETVFNYLHCNTDNQEHSPSQLL